MIRAVVAGAAGRMGSRVLAMLREEKDFAVTGAFERSGTEYVGRDAGGIRIASGIEPALENGADVVIDFTAPSATMQHAPVCAARGVALVIGTTGLSAEQKTELRSLARRIPLLLAPNMSVGVNVLFRLVAEAAKALGATYEIEIVEMHHRMKRDAPSGTALRLAEVAAEALGVDPADAFVYQRHGDVGARKKGTIGVQALRGGDVVGE
ncbi:MAG: 4-hydroxy-tetrahydrodipicolinate reductase, partial [Deltaproteobacteria bacterium]